MRLFASVVLSFFTSYGFCLAAESLDVNAIPHVVVVVGTHHYSADRSMPKFTRGLERFGFRTTLVSGDGDPETKTANVLPGIEALDDADVAIFYVRFLKLLDDEWHPIEKFIKSGKPVIGLRTANHAFKYEKNHPRYHWNDGFGRRVLGTPYIAHQETKTEIRVVEKYISHPVLSGLVKQSWLSPAKLYLTRLEPGCVPLVSGRAEGKRRLLERDFGTMHVNETETDVVAWTWQNEWGAKVFATTLGHAGDFAEASFTRMLVNSVYWAVDRPPPSSSTKIPTWNVEMAVPSKYRQRAKR